MSPLLVLIGPPGAGKSTVASLLGASLKTTVRDTDTDVERASGKPIADIFIHDGEAVFRTAERHMVADALATHEGILALGGGAVMDPHTHDALTYYRQSGGTIVFLDVTLAHAAPRVGFNQSRPLLVGNPRAQWQVLMNARRPTYHQLATFVVDTDAHTPDQVAQRIYDTLQGRQ